MCDAYAMRRYMYSGKYNAMDRECPFGFCVDLR